MNLFSKKSDPLSEQERELDAKLVEVENQIKRLSDYSTPPPPNTEPPRFRSTAKPHGASALNEASADPVFEPVHPRTSQDATNELDSMAFYNELGVRKYDLFGAGKRLVQQFKGPGPSNPKLVNFLAAGSIQGLRPLRYERRVARNRFLLMFAVLLVTLWGIAWMVFIH